MHHACFTKGIPAEHPNRGESFTLDYSINPSRQINDPQQSSLDKTITFCSVKTPFDNILPSLHANNFNHDEDVLR